MGHYVNAETASVLGALAEEVLLLRGALLSIASKDVDNPAYHAADTLMESDSRIEKRALVKAYIADIGVDDRKGKRRLLVQQVREAVRARE